MAGIAGWTQEHNHASLIKGGQDQRGDAMNTEELQQVYGDSHTLDRPTDGEVRSQFRPEPEQVGYHPLDSRAVVESAHDQGWGS